MDDVGGILEKGQALLSLYGLRIIGALAIFLVGKWLARVLSRVARRALERAGTDKTLVAFLVNVAYIAMFAFVIVAAVAQLGVQTTSFIAVLGAAGLAVGLALQGSLSNFAAGVMLILFRPFKVGDFIEAGGAAGIVEEIQIFSTRMRSGDNKTLFVPNGSITGGNIVNYSAKDTRRVDLVFGCSYEDDIKRVKSLLEEIVSADDRILDDPAPVVAVLALADSSVNFAVRPWVKSADYWDVYFALQETVKTRFDAEGISIPFPQQDVHMHSVQAA